VERGSPLSFRSLLARDTGFVPQRVLTMTASLPEQRYPDAASQIAFFERVLAKLQALPGVERAAAVNVLPFSTYDRSARVLVEGAPEPPPGRTHAPPGDDTGYATRSGYRCATADFDARDREGRRPS
jgi:putative ABC transport system permease protein